jgi:hypothetical protein
MWNAPHNRMGSSVAQDIATGARACNLHMYVSSEALFASGHIYCSRLWQPLERPASHWAISHAIARYLGDQTRQNRQPCIAIPGLFDPRKWITYLSGSCACAEWAIGRGEPGMKGCGLCSPKRRSVCSATQHPVSICECIVSRLSSLSETCLVLFNNRACHFG